MKQIVRGQQQSAFPEYFAARAVMRDSDHLYVPKPHSQTPCRRIPPLSILGNSA